MQLHRVKAERHTSYCSTVKKRSRKYQIPPSLATRWWQDLIKNLLVVDPEKRFTADEALLHPWLSTETGNLAGYDLGHGLEQHRIFDARKKLRAAVTAVRSELLNYAKTLS